MTYSRFKKEVWRHYEDHRRRLPWRRTRDPYKILVSEIMLQQTQVARVEPKYREFIRKFPNFRALAHASLREVLRAWQGLGYNRRALHLKKIAAEVTREHGGKLPKDEMLLRRLPGVGQATAGAVRTFALNEPSVFLETNIRTVFIHFFFEKKKKVRDEELLPLIETTLPHRNPRACPPKCSCRREWYWALMDYGAWLKEKRVRYSPRMAGYRPQSRFKGSVREARGKVLIFFREKTRVSERELQIALGVEKRRLRKALSGLVHDRLLRVQRRYYSLAN